MAWKGHALVARLSPTKSQAQLQLDDGYLLALAQQGSARRVRPARAALCLLRAPEGVVVLPRRRRQRGPDPGGPGRPLQGDPRLPPRPRVLVPQLRGAVHHAPDHHRGQDRDAQQAHAAQRLRLLLGDAGRRLGLRADASTRCSPARPCTTRSTRSSPPRSCARSSPASRPCSPSSSRACSSLYLDGYSYTSIGERLGCDCKTVDNALQRVKRKVGAHLDVARRP